MKKKKSGFFQRQAQIMRGFLKRLTPKDIVVCSLYDILFRFVFGIVIFIWARYINIRSRALEPLLATVQDMATASSLSILKSELYSFIGLFSISLVLVIALFIVLYALFRGLFWSTLEKKRFDKEFFVRFLKTNAIWMPLFIIVTLIITPLAFRNTVAAVLILFVFAPLFFHMNNIIGTLAARHEKHGIRHAFRLAFKGFHHMVIPYLLIIVGWIILYIIMRLVSLIPIGYSAHVVISFILLVFYFTKTRYFISEAVNEANRGAK